MQNNIYFTSNGSWTAPTGVTEVMLIGSGAGGSGSTGRVTIEHNCSGAGGGGAKQSTQYVTVVPNTTYTVTIGLGCIDGDGGSTTFGSTVFLGGGGAVGFSESINPYPICGGFDPSYVDTYYDNSIGTPTSPSVGGSICAIPDGYYSTNGFYSIEGYAGGTRGESDYSESIETPYIGGSGGGGGGQGPGGNGGASFISENGVDGSSPEDNTGAGGGGGGGTVNGSTAGAGGVGGSGYLYVFWN